MPFSVKGQNPTVGLIKYDGRVSEGYTLLAPLSSTSTYLIDNCGFVVHTWESDYQPGNTVRLMPNGDLLRATKINVSTFLAGGAGGRVEILSWDSELKWEFFYSTDTYRQHHDVLSLPNGNILILAWDGRNETESLEAGRDPQYLSAVDKEVWGEKIIEVKPLANNNFEIVWEWSLWDHLVQDYDPSKLNYGVVADHPELVNLNFSPDTISPDWIHANAISYSSVLDQIIISSRTFNEFWVIDHSTTTEEAKSHSGGNYGMGGDIIYRYGNPQAYDRGTEEDRKLFGQHDVHWTDDGEGIMLFNNGLNRDPSFSSIDFIDPPRENGIYILDDDLPFGPTNLTRTYKSDEIEGFAFSSFLSGAGQTENGNILICSGATGNLVEITGEGEVVWNYINPVTSQGTLEQGFDIENSDVSNLVFRVYKYTEDYEGLLGKNLERGERLEINSFEIFPCEEQITSLNETITNKNVNVYPNPTDLVLNITFNNNNEIPEIVKLYDLSGNLVTVNVIKRDNLGISLALDQVPNGMYLVEFTNSGTSTYKRIIVNK